MSDYRVYRPELVEQLALLIDGKGKSPSFNVGGELHPTIDLSVLTRSPYSAIGGEVMRRIVPAAVPAENNIAWVSPGIGVALELLEFRIGTAVTADFDLIALTQAEQATIGVAAFLNFVRTRQRFPGVASPNFPEQTASVISQGSNAGVLGAALLRFTVQANVDQIIRFDATALYGDDPGVPNVIQAIGVGCNTVNQAFSLSVRAREWPRPQSQNT